MMKPVLLNSFLRMMALLVPLSVSGAVCSAPELRVDGLFNGRALITIDGESILLKAGEAGHQGVKLISSDSKQAVLEVNGKKLSLGVSEHIAASYSEAQLAEVSLLSGHNGHYYVDGFVNGRPVNFLVDTGASVVAMNMHVAKRLGINYRNGAEVMMRTASGLAKAYEVSLDKLTIGSITQYKVRGVVHIGDFPDITLLGNSFLSNVEMSEEQGVMILRQKY